MLTLVLRRARAQGRLLGAVVTLVAAAAALLGVCALLLGPTQDRAFRVEVERSQPQDVDVTAYLVDLSGADVEAARDEAAGVVRDVLATMRPRVTSAATARMRSLDGTDRLAYLSAGDALEAQTELTSGRWPADVAGGPAQAVVPDAAARLLGLHVGDRVRLGREIGLDGAETPVTVEVVGTFRPTDRAGWSSDPLSGQGYAPAWSDGAVSAPAYGPFVVTEARLLASGSSVTGLRVVAHPTLALAGPSALHASADSLEHASALLTSRVDGRARITRVGSDLPQTLDRIDAQRSTTRAGVGVLVLLATGLSLAAALLAGWLVAAARDEERALLVGLGLSRGQQVRVAAVEALSVAAVATVVAVPVAALAHAWLTHLPSLAAAGLARSPTVTGELVATVLLTAVLLAAALVLTALDAGTAPDRATRRLAVVRTGANALLLGVAVLAWAELRSQPSAGATRGDVTLLLAPAVAVAAVTVLAVRTVPPLLSAAARIGARSRSLVLPLATQQAARRPHLGTAMVLVAAAVAAAVFALSVRTTWLRSQDDQAALQVGTDASLTLAAPAGPQEAAAVTAAAGSGSGQVVSAVVDRPLALGSYLGDPGSPPVLVAVDTRRAGALLRGRTTAGTTWSAIGATLAPEAPVQGVPLPPDGSGVQLAGRAPAGGSITVAVTAVVQDPSGLRSSVRSAPLPLDGRSHPVDWLSPIGGSSRLVGVRLQLDGDPGLGPHAAPETATGDVSVVLDVPGAPRPAPWRTAAPDRDSPVRGTTVFVRPSRDGTEVTASVGLDLGFFAYTGATVLATAFPAPAEVPVAVSQDLADSVGAKVGGRLSATVGETAVRLRVTAIVPTVPSAPGRAAVLADVDTLSRALVGAGDLDPAVDAWWVGHPTAGTVRALRALDLGEVDTRAGVAAQLRRGPLRVTFPTALLTLVAASAVLMLAGVGLVLGADRRRRSADVARLRALGLTRREARRVLLVEHAALLVPLVGVGALVGLACAVALGPHLVRSELGAAPVPRAVVDLPWGAEGLAVGGLLLAGLVVTAVATAAHVRRASPADLRAGDL